MSAHTLTITDGTTTKSFISGDNIALMGYDPLPGKGDNDLITERNRIKFTSSTPATNAANINVINRLFEQARNYARTQTGPKVYINFDPGTSGSAWRSMVFDGEIRYNDRVLSPFQYDKTMIAEIVWTRQPFWEGALTQIPLTNTSATDDITGITISNRTDGGVCQVETATIVGTITGDGNASVILTAAGMTGSPITTAVAVLTDDTPTQSAAKMATALNLDTDITDLFNVASSGADLIVTRLVPAANDATLNIAYDNDTCTGLTGDATSADTTAGSATAHENWVSIKAANVVGDLPAPIKLQMYNSKSGADATDEIYVFHNIFSTPASLDHILEGEDATGATVTDIADGTSSGGFYGQLSYTATTETLVATWAISAATLDYMKGGRFKLMARWAVDFPYADMYLHAKLVDGNVIKHEGKLKLIPTTRQLHEIDTFDAPTNKNGTLSLRAANLELYALRNQSGAHTIKLDYLEMVPASSGWKRFKTNGNGVAYQEYFIHDATEGITYKTDTGDKDGQDFSDYGPPIMLTPNAVQKLYITTCDYNGDAHVEQTWTLKLWYRPRRSVF